ncbi:hypothetical protein L204_105878 [Cryptococcus depauperatus]
MEDWSGTLGTLKSVAESGTSGVMLANHGLAWRREGLDGLLSVLKGGRVVDTSRGVGVDAVNGKLDSVEWVGCGTDGWLECYGGGCQGGMSFLQLSILSTQLSWCKGDVLDGIFKPASAGDVESKREARPVQ